MHVVSWETNKTFFKIYFAANRGKPKLSNMGPVSPMLFFWGGGRNDILKSKLHRLSIRIISFIYYFKLYATIERQ